MGKVSIRKQFLECRKQIDFSAYLRLSRQAQHHLIASEQFAQAQSVALYSPVNNEVATEEIFLTAKKLEKKVYYPRVTGDEFGFFAVPSLTELERGAFGVAEPISEEEVSIATLDLVIVPGVAFDLHGYRLGYGRGFYDRRLVEKSIETVSVGLCFDLQLCEFLPTEAHDQPLDFIVTETKFIPCHI